jgi:ribosomal protein S18 acetylase RimI-like enzyme
MADIRPYKTSDYLQVKEMLEKQEMFDLIWDAEENFAFMIKNDPEAIFVAEVDGKIVGSILMSPHGSEAVFFYRFVVKEEFRDKGIGSSLFEHAEQVAKKKGYKEIVFYVNSANERLQNYYKKKGYQKTDRTYVCMFKSFKD